MTGEMEEESLEFQLDRDTRWQAGNAMRAREMSRRLPRLLLRSLQLSWQADRPSVVALLVCQTAAGVMQAFGLLATTRMISALIGSGQIIHRLWAAWPSVAVLAAVAGGRAILMVTMNWLSSRLAPVIVEEAEHMLLKASLNTELTAYDSPGYKDAYEAAERGACVTEDLIRESQDLILALATFAAGAAVLTAIYPALLPLLVLAGMPQAVAQIQSARFTYLAQVQMWGHQRLRNVLRWHMTDSHSADQIRSATMMQFLLSRYRRIMHEVTESQRGAVGRGARAALIGTAGGGLASTLVWGALIWLLASGRVSVAETGTAILALRTVTSSVQSLVSAGARLFRTGYYMDAWADFLDRAGGFHLRSGLTSPSSPREIRVKDLHYRYQGADRDALDAVTMTVRSGEVLAVVGENGSGKTTISKLLTGLYLPAAGSVEWDGLDTREMDAAAAWRHVAMVPQDYARWPFSARENITLGQPGPRGDEAVWEACRASGADEVVGKLRSGLGTLLAREWLNGEELSGGQWQRIALARAFHRSAGLLVLDEPTAALDPRAEHRIFAGLRELAQDRAVVLITHRLTNVAIADRIVVLDKGRIVQEGTFQQLANRPGLFRDLWELQNDRASIAAIPTQPTI